MCIDRATFVKDYNTFWTQVPAVALVRVGRASGVVTPAYQAPTTYSRDQASYPYVPPSTTTTTSTMPTTTSSTTTTTTTTRVVSTSPNPSTTQWSFAKQVAQPHLVFVDPVLFTLIYRLIRLQPQRRLHSCHPFTWAVVMSRVVLACREALASRRVPVQPWSPTLLKANVMNLNCGPPIRRPMLTSPLLSPTTTLWATIACLSAL